MSGINEQFMGIRKKPALDGSPGTAAARPGLLHIQDQKASNTAAGGFTSGAWRTRVFNTILTNEITGASLASNQITLPAGTYYIEASAPAHQVNNHKVKLYDITNSGDLLIGSSEKSGNGDQCVTSSAVAGRITAATEIDIELQHYCATTAATNGLGLAVAFSVIEVYADIKIWEVLD